MTSRPSDSPHPSAPGISETPSSASETGERNGEIDRSAQPPSSQPPTAAVAPPRRSPRNFLAIALYQILVRIGWIFKTESIVMPAFMDAIGGTPAMRGCLPMLNRFGASVPPMLFARRLKNMPQKRRALFRFSFATGVAFWALGLMATLAAGGYHAWAPWTFLAIYGAFFAFHGLDELSLGVLHGRLIPATSRGRLMTISTSLGAPLAILAAWFLMGNWLARPDGGFAMLFLTSGTFFVAASLATFLLVEPDDSFDDPPVRFRDHFTSSAELLRRDANFRRLAVVAGLFGASLMLFPHYQALARQRLDLDLTNLMLWVIVQNAGAGLFSLLAGPVADWQGNRVVVRTAILICGFVPLLAIALVHVDPEIGRRLYWLVFLPLGLTPVTIRSLSNYTLEICQPSDHPRYLSTLSFCLAAPIVVFAALVGWLVSLTSFELVFTCGAGLILLGGLLTFRLDEPRRRRRPPLAVVAPPVE
jgi:hypothetical protein